MAICKIGKEWFGGNNSESTISDFMKQFKRKRLEGVERSERGDLLLSFSDEDDYNNKNVVRQYSKKKYNNSEDCIKMFKSFDSPTEWQVISVIELPRVWLIFFRRNILKE